MTTIDNAAKISPHQITPGTPAASMKIPPIDRTDAPSTTPRLAVDRPENVSHHPALKLRVFIDFICERCFPMTAPAPRSAR
jgi:hypothetical protein